MTWFKRKVNAGSHPDPATALKLHHIKALLRLHTQSEQQIQLYLDEIEDVHREMSSVSVARRSSINRITQPEFDNIITACKNRISVAETSIATCRQSITDTQHQIDEYTVTSGLTTFDLAYLNLRDR